MYLFNCLFILLFCKLGFGYELKLSCESPVVLGAVVNCTAQIFDDNGSLAAGTFNYFWVNDFVPHGTREKKRISSVDTWNITYGDPISNPPGTYVIRVEACYFGFLDIFCNTIDSKGFFIEVTSMLNGQLDLYQSGVQRKKFVSSSEPVQNSVDLHWADKQYLSNATSVLSFWFVDCVYYGITTDFHFDFNYTKPEESHVIEALVMGDFTPLPPPTTPAPTTTTTTTTAPNTTTSSKPTSSTPVTTSIPSTNETRSTAPIRSKRIRREVTATPLPQVTAMNSSNIKIWQNGTLVPYNGSFPYVCNSTFVATDPKKVYGHFSNQFQTKAPISDVNISGTNWLQHGELLMLNVKCAGSKRLQYCILYKQGIHNTTNNETCAEFADTDVCDFPIKHLFQDSDKNTVIIIIKNDVSVKVTSVIVTVYKVKQQAQLSVIVIPVAFSLVAVVTIVFGVAYYLQNRSRIIVEVADFDFGQQYADMEYKTFKDRLRDSIVNAFTRDPAASDAPNWPSGHKYGSMT